MFNNQLIFIFNSTSSLSTRLLTLINPLFGLRYTGTFDIIQYTVSEAEKGQLPGMRCTKVGKGIGVNWLDIVLGSKVDLFLLGDIHKLR